jgi:hypothetical protein
LITLAGAGAKTLSGRTWNNAGTVNWTGGNLSLPGSTDIFNNLPGGLFNAQTAANVTGLGAFNNLAGATVSKNSAGTTDFQTLFTNAGTVNAASGLLNFSNAAGYSQSAGITHMNGGAITVSGPGGMNLNGGVLQGTGSLTAFVSNSGATLKPGGSPGTLTINGDYVQGPGGTLEVDLGGLTQGVNYDLLSVTGSAVLDGTVKANLYGGFTGAVGDVFDIVSAGGGITGNFATISGPIGYGIGSDILGNIASLDIYSIAAVQTLPVLPPVFDPASQIVQGQQEQQQIVVESISAPEESVDEREKRKGLPLCR